MLKIHHHITFATVLTSLLWGTTPLCACGKTVSVFGKISEKSAFDLQEKFIRNSDAKINHYPHQNYKVTLARVKHVSPQDVTTVREALRKAASAHNITKTPLNFYLSKAEMKGKILYMVGEHALHSAYDFCQDLEKALATLKTPSGQKYSITNDAKDIPSLSIVTGEAVAVKPEKISYWVNKRIEQDRLIYNDSTFTIPIENIMVD